MFRIDIAINNLPWRELATVDIPEFADDIPFDTTYILDQTFGFGISTARLRIVRIH